MADHVYHSQSDKLGELKQSLQTVLDSFHEDPEKIAEMLAFKSRFWNYSLRNSMLIYRQNPYSTYVASIHDWNKKSYRVKKGQHGIKVLFPIRTELIPLGEVDGKLRYRRVADATPEQKQKIKNGELKTVTYTRFGVGTVFDISQTDCPEEDYPRFFNMGYSSDQHKALYSSIKKYAEQKGIPVKEEDLKSISLRGAFYPKENVIRINDKLNDTERLSTLTHELGHALMHNNTEAFELPEPVKELEADCISIMLQNYVGIHLTDTRKNHFVQNYKACTSLKDFNLDEVLKAVDEAYLGLQKELQPILNIAIDEKQLHPKKEVLLEDLAKGQRYYDKEYDEDWHDTEMRTAYEAINESNSYGGSPEYGPPMSDSEIKQMFDNINNHRETISIDRIYQENGETIIDTSRGEIPSGVFLRMINEGKAVLEPVKSHDMETETVNTTHQKAEIPLIEALLNADIDILDFNKYDVPAEMAANYSSEELIAYQSRLGMNDDEFKAWTYVGEEGKPLLLRDICFCRVNGLNFANYRQKQIAEGKQRLQLQKKDENLPVTKGSQKPSYHDFKEHDEAVLDYIKHDVSLLTVAQAMGFTPVQEGRYYSLKEHDSVKIYPETNSFCQFSSGKGGSPIDFLMTFEGCSKKEAIQKLEDQFVGGRFDVIKAAQQERKPMPVQEKKEFILPEKVGGKYTRVYAYLTKTRCLDADIVKRCMSEGLIYEDSKHNAVFVGKDDAGQPVYATRHTTLTESNFKRDVAGSRQDVGWMVKNGKAEKLYVCEAPIDALSIMTLLKQQGKPIAKASFLATCGTCKDAALYARLRANPQIKEVSLANDNDEAGQKANEKIYKALQKDFPGIRVKLCTPNTGKDINECLCKKPKKEIEKGQEVER